MTAATKERLRRYADTHGPQTCGCVAAWKHDQEMWAMAHHVKYPAWPMCPICQGSGIDPRVPVNESRAQPTGTGHAGDLTSLGERAPGGVGRTGAVPEPCEAP